MGAVVDCELIRSGILGQPANTLTTLAFLVGGAVLAWRRPEARWVAVGLAATGLGSFLFHGPMPPGSELAHDLGLAWLVVLAGSMGRGWERWSRIPALAVMAPIFVVSPAIADPFTVALVVVAVFAVLRDDYSPRTLAPLTVIAFGAVVGRLGATGGPLCDPASLLQPHALWHLAAAVGMTWWVLTFRAAKPAQI